jgi:dihydrofolate reductase
MRKIVAGFASSLDGYIEGAHGEYDWILIDKEIDFSEQMKRFDAFLFGRRSYEMVLSMGNKASQGIKNYVISNTLNSAAENFTLIKNDIGKQIGALKQQQGKDIAVFGGATLLASLLDLHLVDEISVAVIPVLLGQGKPMVDRLTNKVWLSFISNKVYENGTVQLTFAVTYSDKESN